MSTELKLLWARFALGYEVARKLALVLFKLQDLKPQRTSRSAPIPQREP